ncbi:hypothetical protein C8A00DRAFT_33972 [Chaetomidium leptoderma]|uniref:PCI domain-containing protein n=1 Tax=Chaetomidium leptoderma TaxID=669021 RepID=A0AAN6ZWV7_9PEZI|nr:hypothetical protein C8A00DRAFT_33972 [Chaetomidium leptoderma]
MEQTKALNALEPFLALSKSATSPRAAADLIVRATSAPNTYIFTELLQTPQVQALGSSDEFAPYLTLLRIFSHGTYSSFVSTAGLPALNDAQQLKLRQLSLLTLTEKTSNTNNAGSPALDYASLQTALNLPSRQALEELVISAIYAGLLKAQLNPKASLVQINSVSPLRDVAPTAISGLLYSLQAWAGRCDATLQSLSCQMSQLRADADRRAARAAARTQETRKLMESEQTGAQDLHTTSSLPPPTTAAAASVGTKVAAFRKSLRTARTHMAGSGFKNNHGGGSNNNTATTTNNDMNSVLTVGGSSNGRFLPPGGSCASTTPADSTHLQVRSAVKRGSGDMDGDADGDGGGGGGSVGSGVGGEGMDIDDDDDDDPDGKKRAKLEA